MIRLFIGFDQAEAVAYHAMVQSIIDTCTQPIAITPLKMSMLPQYKRPRDPRQSNEFSFTRFLVPSLCGFRGHAIFMDLDMMLRTDISELWNLKNQGYAVQVVKHDYTPRTATKYLGNVQHAYPRKNWSSVMLFNCEHPDCRKLTDEYVNTATPEVLQRLAWTDDENIGELEPEWNWLVGEYPYNAMAKNVHWTIEGPWFPAAVDADYADEWRGAFGRAIYSGTGG